jgi:predicted DNA binding CopG/RHH family protein
MGDLQKLKKSYPQTMRTLRERISKVEQELMLAKERYEYQRSVTPTQMRMLEADLEAIDRSLSLHAIQINPELLEPLHGQEAIRITSYGAVTRNIHKCLRIANGKPLLTTQIAIYVAKQCKVNLSEEQFPAFKESVRCRLKGLAYAQKITRLPTPKGAEGRWARNPELAGHLRCNPTRSLLDD